MSYTLLRRNPVLAGLADSQCVNEREQLVQLRIVQGCQGGEFIQGQYP